MNFLIYQLKNVNKKAIRCLFKNNVWLATQLGV